MYMPRGQWSLLRRDAYSSATVACVTELGLGMVEGSVNLVVHELSHVTTLVTGSILVSISAPLVIVLPVPPAPVPLVSVVPVPIVAVSITVVVPATTAAAVIGYPR